MVLELTFIRSIGIKVQIIVTVSSHPWHLSIKKKKSFYCWKGKKLLFMALVTFNIKTSLALPFSIVRMHCRGFHSLMCSSNFMVFKALRSFHWENTGLLSSTSGNGSNWNGRYWPLLKLVWKETNIWFESLQLNTWRITEFYIFLEWFKNVLLL